MRVLLFRKTCLFCGLTTVLTVNHLFSGNTNTKNTGGLFMPNYDVCVRFTGVLSKTVDASDKQEALKKMESQIEESIDDLTISDVQFNNGDMKITETESPHK